MTRDAIAVRAVPVAVAATVALVQWAASPDSLTPGLAVVAVTAAVAAAAAPASALVTLTLLVLAGQFASASSGRSGTLLLAWTVLFAVALWAVHHLFAFAALVPRDAVVDRSAVRRLTARLAAMAALVAPVVTILLVIADFAPATPVTRVVGVAAAAVAALVPAWAAVRGGAATVSRRG
jgi:hypothetical protein